jgi:transposase
VKTVPNGTVERLTGMWPTLDEKQRRYMAAYEARGLGHGGIKAVAEITGLTRKTISKGITELDTPQTNDKRARKKGGGRKKKEEENPDLKQALIKRVDPITRGDPESSLKWVSKSLRHLAADLKKNGYNVSHTVVGRILKKAGYSLQANQKTREGCKTPDRDAQFSHINEQSKKFIRENQPVLSIDTKKKELIGNFKNAGQEYAPKGKPEEVNAHDFRSDALFKAVPYGIYDIVKNEGWVSVGISSDTASFAVETIRRWWNGLGKASYPNATKLMLTADCGGSNSMRARLFKVELQKLANELKIEISVCHFPPGTSKWNKIEHRLFSFITQNWRGQPLVDLVTIVNLIGNTRTNAGLKVCCELDDNTYETGVVVSKKEIDALNIVRDEFHGEWNYTIKPQM